MSYISERRALILNRLSKVQSALSALYDVQDEMAATGAQSYEFDSGEGKQRTTRRTLKEINDSVDRLEAKQSSLLNQKYGTGTPVIRVRRKSGGYNRGTY